MIVIIELLGAPGSGKTFLINQFLEGSSKKQKFLTREDFSSWVKTRSRSFKLQCIFFNLPLSISYMVLLIFLRAAVKKPNVAISWIPKAILNEVLLREFLKLNSKSVILLDQGSVQRIVCYILFSYLHRPFFVQYILHLMFLLLSKHKIYVFIKADISVATERVIHRTKDPSISRFDSLQSKDSLKTKISEVTHLFSSLAFGAIYKTNIVYTYDNTKEHKKHIDVFKKFISMIIK